MKSDFILEINEMFREKYISKYFKVDSNILNIKDIKADIIDDSFLYVFVCTEYIKQTTLNSCEKSTRIEIEYGEVSISYNQPININTTKENVDSYFTSCFRIKKEISKTEYDFIYNQIENIKTFFNKEN